MISAFALCLCAAAAFAATAETVPGTFERERAGRVWQDGLFAGNGSHGVLAYAPSHLEWVINKNDLFDRRVAVCSYTPHKDVMEYIRTNAVKSVNYLHGERKELRGNGDGLTSSISAAILRVRFWDGVGWSAPAVPATRQQVDLGSGELLGRMVSPVLTPEALTIVPHDPDVVAIRLSDPNSKSRRTVIEIARPEDPRMSVQPAFRVEGEVVSFEQALPYGDKYAVAMLVTGGKPEIRGSTGSVKASGPRDVFIAVRTARACADPRAAAVAAVRQAAELSFEKLRAANAAWWKDFWAKGARAEFASAPVIDRAWKYALYALGGQFSASPMPPLNGLTYGPIDGGDAGVGSNCYVHDQNVQIPLMPFFPLNHCDYVRTFAKTYMDVMPELERRTREVFGVAGAYLPLNMNLDGVEYPIGHYRYTLCGGAYSGLILAQAWKYSRDEALLKEVYPLLKKFILFYTETMRRDGNGTYHFIWSVPPEIFTGSEDELAIVACLKPCLETAAEAAALFKCDGKEAALWKDILAHYPTPAKQSGGGWWGGPQIPDDHYMYGGHLFYPFFPAESFLDRETAEKTLAYTWTNAVEISWSTPEPHPNHEWSAFYTGVARGRLHGGADGWKALMDFHGWFAKPNGLFSHNPVIVTDMTREEMNANAGRLPPMRLRGTDGVVHGWGRSGGMDLTPNPDAKGLVCPVLEGAAAFLFLSTETLLQSWGGEIRLFPGVPANFTGSFENFLAQGGYRVSAEMKGGKLVDYRIGGVKEGAKLKVTCPSDPSFKQLPGEPAWKKPLVPAVFPDVLSACVWRNWGLVPKRILAETVGATEAEITALATEMGLAPDPFVPPEWRRKGYVTILRRNWHLLGYAQLMKVVDMSRQELAYSLVEDDFLFGKLGSVKPDAPKLLYTKELADAGRAGRLAFRKTLEEEGVVVADPSEKPRFAFLKELSELTPELESVTAQTASDGRFDHRMIFPYCSDYGDPLADKEVSSCPEGLIARLAARGVDALWFHFVLSTVTTDPKYPEFGQEAPQRLKALKTLVARAAKHGVKIYLYVNEPRAQPAAFFEKPGRMEMRGSPDRQTGLRYSMCTRHPATLAWLEGALEQLFRNVPGLGGVFTITMSENMTHCASAFDITCERCKGHPYSEFILDVNRSIVKGVKAGKPDAEVWFFDVAWPDDAPETVVPYLPKEGRLIAWSEKLMPYRQAGADHTVSEYSISHPGPGPRAVKLWNAAQAAGLKSVAKLQVSTSWEICAVPYLPTMDLVAEHAYNLSAAAVDSVMLSWSLGGYPSPNLQLFNEFRKGEKNVSALLDRFAAKLYGGGARDAVRRAWSAYSAGFREYPMEWQTVYYSPVQMGPANLLYPQKTGYQATMVNTPYDDLGRWTGGYPKDRAAWVSQMHKVAEGFAEGDRLWKDVIAKTTGAAQHEAGREAVIFRTATLHFKTSADQADFIAARDRGDKAAMRAAAEKELATAKEFLPLVRAESRLGFESSNRYMYVPNDILEKIVCCRKVLSEL
ncbi:MAG TPA: hypothetical protein PKI32_00345 [Opitutales bacterium]|nr:hypothetical protein [Opitutales bacterium]